MRRIAVEVVADECRMNVAVKVVVKMLVLS